MLDDKTSLIEGLERAVRKGDQSLLEFLEDLLDECREAKWQEAGQDHRIWKRNWSIFRGLHIKAKDAKTPWPTENHIWSIIEAVRPIWGDNPPQCTITPLFPGLEVQCEKLEALMRWGLEVSRFDDLWENLYDFLAPIGTAGAKVFWDHDKQVPGVDVVDPRALYYGVGTRYNHRTARIVATVYNVDVGELRSLFPSLSPKITQDKGKDSERGGNQESLAVGADTERGSGGKTSGSSISDRTAEVCEMWIKPDLSAEIEDALGEEEDEAPLGAALPINDDTDEWMVFTFIPGAGVINKDVVKTGLQIASGQCWSCPDSPWGISDLTMSAGLQLASDRIAIRGDQHRLAMFAPPLINPKTTGLQRRHLSGRPAPIWEPADERVALGLRYLNVAGPNKEAMDFFLTRPNTMRKILGIDELTPDFFNRSQTAAATSMVLAALENRTRGKLRRMRAMVEDIVSTMLRLIIDRLPAGIVVRGKEDGDYRTLTREDLEGINLSMFSIQTNLGKPGPLSNQARLNSWMGLLGTGALNIQVPMIRSARMGIIDSSDISNREEVKKELAAELDKIDALQAAMTQQPTAPTSTPTPTPSGPETTLPPSAAETLPPEGPEGFM